MATTMVAEEDGEFGSRRSAAALCPNSEEAESSGMEPFAANVGDYEPEGFLERWLHPFCLGALRPAPFLVLLMCVGVILSGATTGLFSSSGAAVQRSLGLSATEWGLLGSVYEAFAVIGVIITSHYGGRSHIPRFVGALLLVFCLGLALFTVPHFAFYAGTEGYAASDQVDLCSVEAECPGRPESQKAPALLVFLFAQLLIALGASSFWVLGPIFLDRNVSQSQMSLYLAGLYAAASLGPAAGFLLNGQFLNSWVSAGEEPPEGLSPSSPLWLGRWWLGYLLFCASCLVLIFPISCFPRYLPDTVEVRRAKLKSAELVVNHAPSQQTAFNLEASRGDEFSPRAERALKLAAKDARTFVSACRDVLTPMRVFTMLAHGTENFAVSAMSTFLPQIVQEQFGLSAGFTSMVFGGSIVLGATTGIVAGGWFVRWRGYGGVETARFCLVAALLAVPLSFCFLAMGCPGDGVLATSSADDFDGLVSLAEGRCEEPVSCGSRLVLFFVLFFFLMFTTFLNNVPGTQVILRSTELKERPLAVALNSVISRLTGGLPAPLIFGLLLDKLCLVYSSETCTGGACLLTDHKRVRYLCTIVAVSFKVVSSIFLLLAWQLYKRRSSS